ncbi:MAG: hypothetical protein Q9169_005132 [Polycauliona sp. 2 TL-2023]
MLPIPTSIRSTTTLSLLFALFTLLLFPTPTTSVSITISYGTTLWASCRNIPPGTCCTPAPPQSLALDALFTRPPSSRPRSKTMFSGLLHQQLGAGWPADADADNSNGVTTSRRCEGAPILRVFGAGYEHEAYLRPANPYNRHDAATHPQRTNVVGGASWVDLRTRFPPDSAGSRYLAWQGVKGAVWGRDTWSVASGGIPFGSRRRFKRRSSDEGGGGEVEAEAERGAQRFNDLITHGTIEISTPTRWVSPDIWGVDGTEYRREGDEEGAGYRSEEGVVLDFF